MRTTLFLLPSIICCSACVIDDTEYKETPNENSEDNSTEENDSVTSDNEEDSATTSDNETDEERSATVCSRWIEDRVNLDEGVWRGDIDTCEIGEISSVSEENALRLVNLYRWLSGLPEVGTQATLNEKAQECALMMHAYGGLTHYPSEDFECYTAHGAEAAGKSNISPYPGVYSVDLYMSDPGNETTLGHRRWILSNGLGPIGLGSTSDYSCMWVMGGTGSDSADWTAWPPAGIVPYELMNLAWATLEETGWSLQSDSIDLRNAAVTVTRDDGTELPMNIRDLGEYYGSRWAISMIPSGWVSEANRSYTVHVEADGGSIDYQVELIDCSAFE